MDMLITIQILVTIHVHKVNGVDKETLCGKTTAKVEGPGFGQVDRMELERLRVEVAQLRSSTHRNN